MDHLGDGGAVPVSVAFPAAAGVAPPVGRVRPRRVAAGPALAGTAEVGDEAVGVGLARLPGAADVADGPVVAAPRVVGDDGPGAAVRLAGVRVAAADVGGDAVAAPPGAAAGAALGVLGALRLRAGSRLARGVGGDPAEACQAQRPE